VKKEICFENFRYRHHTTADPVNTKFPRHAHKTCEIIYLVGGDISYVIETQRFRLVPGDIVLVPASRHHFAVTEGNVPYERAVLDFPETMVDMDLIQRVIPETRVYHTASIPAFRDLYSRLDSYADFPHKRDRERLAAAVLTELLCLLCGLDPSLAVPAGGRQDSTVESALKYMEENLTTIRSMDEICHALYISPSHLCKAFGEVLNTSPLRYLRRRRMHHAHDLLRSGERPTNLYQECGFRDYSSFYRAYREYFGISPADQS
jgi:AraC-like DNA-binding protein/mannose-6-phosphate isomerase-like protein (cupin superfamily)